MKEYRAKSQSSNYVLRVFADRAETTYAPTGEVIITYPLPLPANRIDCPRWAHDLKAIYGFEPGRLF